MIKRLTDDEMLEIAASLEDYHKVFYIFWELSSVTFDDTVPTACVSFPKRGKPEMKLGEKFWLGLNLRERLFVICHECLHVLLDHGIRNGMDVPGATPELVNKAQDITINEMIVSLFGYNRTDLRGWEKYCWIDTCFKDPSKIKHNETFIYYLKKLIEDPPKGGDSGNGPKTLDEHDNKGDGTPTDPEENENDNKDGFAATLAEDLTVDEIEEIMKAVPASSGGTMRGTLEAIIEKKIKKMKIKFANLIRKLKKSSMKEIERDMDSFTQEDRRFGDLLRRLPDVSLPGKAVVARPSPDRLLTAVFMDISGSCMSYFEIFKKVFAAFDEERDIFDTRLFIFDTSVVEVHPGQTISVGGGTYFNILEQKCLELEVEVGRYPDCVVVITDGWGNAVSPKAASKWIWLLTPTDWTATLIPINSRKFFINQITFD